MRRAQAWYWVPAFLAAVPLAAQEAGVGEGAGAGLPEGWQARLDRAGSELSQVSFEVMEPGWHVKTGPAGIFYTRSRRGEGTYRAKATFNLFDPGQRHREAYGIFVGGRDLDGEGQAYLYFLIRDDGSFLIKQRAGAQAETLAPWTKHESIVLWEASETSAENALAVDVGAEEVAFSINGQEVARLPRGDLATDGIVGLRINHSLNLHISELSVSG